MITKDAKNILIADDSMFFRKKLGDILTEAGHSVDFARNGMEAVETLAARPEAFDLLTLDLDLPDLSGFEVLAWLKDRGRSGRPPVVVISSIFQTYYILERLKSLGAADFITKDFSPQELILHCNRLMFPDKAANGVSPRERVPVSIPVDFAAADGPHSGFLMNLSKTGAYLCTDATLVSDVTLRLRFVLPGTDSTLTLDGVVRWTTDERGLSTRFGGGGIMFLVVSPQDGQAIEAFINIEAKRLAFLEVVHS